MNKIPDPKKMKKIKGPKLTPRQLQSAKIRITTYLDRDLLNILRQLAHESGSKYQTILNQVLRESLLGEEKGLVARIARLERTVFKQKAA